MTLSQLKSELKEKEKERDDFLENCIKKNNITGKYETILSNEEKTLGLIISAEISALKKGISACEEALEQREVEHKKQIAFIEAEARSSQRTKDMVDAYRLVEQRNQEILEIIDNIKRYNIYCDMDGCREIEEDKEGMWIDFDELKQQLTNSEDEK